MLTRLLASFLSLTHVAGFTYYQDEVPNGDRIPHPCKRNYVWPGLGHKNELGGGSRNVFGLDFAAAGYKWTKDLCNKDSDGDGKTNGAELGDPNCVWTKGKSPDSAHELSHPGVCEPVGASKCNITNDWNFCKQEQFTCNATRDIDVQTLTVRLDETIVPAQDTTYICQHFAMPIDKDYHLIAWKPVISNQAVVHHMVLFGCDADGAYNLNDPHGCGILNGKCRSHLAGWAMGDSGGDCWPDDLGVLIGKNSGFSHIMIQLHWNNPQKQSNYKDSSGFTLYISPKLRKYSQARFTIGQLYISIPPGRQSYEVSASCRSSCSSKNLNESIYIYRGFVHMHLSGVSGALVHYRNGKKIGDIVVNRSFNFNRLDYTKHNPPIEFKPGDEMKLSCNYKSTSKTEVTGYDDGTQGEMCFAFIDIFPASATKHFQYCLDYGSIAFCKEEEEKYRNTVIGDCHLGDFVYEDLEKIGNDIQRYCTGSECPPECKTYMENVLGKMPCRQNPAKEVIAALFKNNSFLKTADKVWDACKLR